jgi:hypothetical protein
MRALPVLVVALLLSAAVGATGGVAGPPDDGLTDRPGSPPTALDDPTVAQVDANGSTLEQINVLDVPAGSVDRAEVTGHYVDLGPSVGLSTNATTERVRTLAMVERIQRAETTERRRERLRTALRDLNGAVDELDNRQTAAVERYGRGDLSDRELLVVLVRIGIVGEELDERRTRLKELAADTRGFDIDRGRLASIGNRLSAFDGPVRSHARTVLDGETGTHSFYIATGSESVVVSTVVDDTYLREAYRGDLRNGAGAAIELEVALEIVAESYPVIWNTTREQTQVFGGGETYPVRIGHSRGDLTAFVDSDARVVYAEHQRHPLEAVVADRRVRATGDAVRLVVNQTYPGGPVQIGVRSTGTGDPVDAAVSVKSGPTPAERIGQTGDDGTLWTLSPNRQYTVTVEAGGENVSAVVGAGEPPRVVAGDRDGGGVGTATPTRRIDGRPADVQRR